MLSITGKSASGNEPVKDSGGIIPDHERTYLYDFNLLTMENRQNYYPGNKL